MEVFADVAYVNGAITENWFRRWVASMEEEQKQDSCLARNTPGHMNLPWAFVMTNYKTGKCYTEFSEWGRGSVGRGSVSCAKSQVRAGSYSIIFISTIYLKEYEFYFALWISSPNSFIIYGEGKMIHFGKIPSIEEI